MNSLRTIKALLVVNAVLLGALVWIGRTHLLPAPAAAQMSGDFADLGVSNVGPRQRLALQQRVESIDDRLAALERLFREGTLRVEVVVPEPKW
jgi:hypothetical protein